MSDENKREGAAVESAFHAADFRPLSSSGLVGMNLGVEDRCVSLARSLKPVGVENSLCVSVGA